MVFLGLYYAVLVRRSFSHVTVAEALLYVWIAGFAYDEFGEWVDAGQTSFYASDFWWTWDIVWLLLMIVDSSKVSTEYCPSRSSLLCAPLVHVFP
jgi:hypothetical protein